MRTPSHGIEIVPLALLLACSSPSDPAEDGGTTSADADGSTSTSSSSSDQDGTTAVGDDTGASTTANTTDEADSGSSDSTGPDDGSSEDTGPADVCNRFEVCVEVPAPWQGPVQIEGGLFGTTRCGDPTGEELFFDDLFAPPADCDCSCDDVGTPACPGSVELEFHADAGCGGADATTAIGPACTSSLGATPGEPSSWQIAGPGVLDVSCEASLVDSTIPAAFADEYRACSLGAQVACGANGLCTTPPEDSAVCIWRDGDFPCPEGTLTERSVRYRDFVDDRTCTECSCLPPTETCTGTATLYTLDTCSTSLFWDLPTDTCLDLGGVGPDSAVLGGPLQPPAEIDCSGGASGGMPEGTAGVVDPVTICCSR